MKPTIVDSALYVKHSGNRVIEVCGSYVDESLTAGSSKLQTIIEATLMQFESKPQV